MSTHDYKSYLSAILGADGLDSDERYCLLNNFWPAYLHFLSAAKPEEVELV